jgi:hypothetical protein
MEVKSINPTAKYIAELANGQHLELEMTFIPVALAGLDFARTEKQIVDGKEIDVPIVPSKSTMMIGMIVGAIISWNLFTPDGTALPCTLENKELQVPMFVGEELKSGGWVGIDLFNFAASEVSFLKN